MRKFIKTSFLLLFSALLLAVSNPLAAQELEVIIEDDIIEKVEKHPLRIRFLVGYGLAWYSVTTKDDFQQTVFPNEYPYNQLSFDLFYSDTHFSNDDWNNWCNMSSYRITGVRPASHQGISLGLAFEKQITPQLSLEVAPTLVTTELSITYEAELELTDIDQKYDQLEVMSRDLSAVFIELPVLVKYWPFENPFFLVGGISPKMKFEKGGNIIHIFDRRCFQQNMFDMSADFGIGYQFTKRLGVQLRMSLGLLNVIKGREEEPMFFYLALESVRTNQLRIDFVF